MAHELGGDVIPADHREYGPANVTHHRATTALFAGLDREQPVWMSHGDSIIAAARAGFSPTAQTDSTPYRRPGRRRTRNLYGIQFHPEVVHTPRGRDVLRNFVVGIAGRLADLDRRQLHRHDRRRRSATGSTRHAARDRLGRPGHLRAVGRRRLGRRGGARPSGGRRPADLHLRRPRPDAQEGVGAAPGRPSSATSG